MIYEIFVSSIILAWLFLALLALKSRISLRLALISATIIGFMVGAIVNGISLAIEINPVLIVAIEIALIFLLTGVAVLFRFYRDPDRKPPENNHVILSPADGKIIYISPVEKASALISTKGNRKFKLTEITMNNLLPDTAYLIGIDMNFINVHVNRSPVEGKVLFQKHINGHFISLGKPESEVLNERVTTVIGNGLFRIGVIQIASRLVRQIVSYVKEGDSLVIGQRIGKIRFGSQVDEAIPRLKNLRITAQIGDSVQAETSIIARYD